MKCAGVCFSLCAQDFEALQGRADGKTVFYEALSRSLGGVKENELLKEAAAWFYSLDHSPSPAGYNLFSRALNNATRSEKHLLIQKQINVNFCSCESISITTSLFFTVVLIQIFLQNSFPLNVKSQAAEQQIEMKTEKII